MTTNCVFPPELDDKQLLAYLDDRDANPETARHIEQCSYCREKSENLDRFQKQLKRRLYRSTCPPPEKLGDFHLRLLPPNQVLEVTQHLRKCPHCVEEVTRLEEFLSDLAPRVSVLEPIRTLFAHLANAGPESVSGHALPAVRGQATKSPIFEVDDIVISLDVQPDPDGQISILGLMVVENQDEWTGATVKLKQTYLAPLTAQVDDLGAFTFSSLYPGPTRITVTSPNGIEVETETVNLET